MIPHSVKVPLGPQFWYSIFLHFRKWSVVVSCHAKFRLITMTGSRFFRTVFVEILPPPLLALVPEAGLRISGSDVRGSPQTNLVPRVLSLPPSRNYPGFGWSRDIQNLGANKNVQQGRGSKV